MAIRCGRDDSGEDGAARRLNILTQLTRCCDAASARQSRKQILLDPSWALRRWTRAPHPVQLLAEEGERWRGAGVDTAAGIFTDAPRVDGACKSRQCVHTLS